MSKRTFFSQKLWLNSNFWHYKKMVLSPFSGRKMAFGYFCYRTILRQAVFVLWSFRLRTVRSSACHAIIVRFCEEEGEEEEEENSFLLPLPLQQTIIRTLVSQSLPGFILLIYFSQKIKFKHSNDWNLKYLCHLNKTRHFKQYSIDVISFSLSVFNRKFRVGSYAFITKCLDILPIIQRYWFFIEFFKKIFFNSLSPYC